MYCVWLFLLSLLFVFCFLFLFFFYLLICFWFMTYQTLKERRWLSSLLVMNEGTYWQAKNSDDGDDSDVFGLSPFAFASSNVLNWLETAFLSRIIIMMMSCDRNSITYHMCAPSLTYINSNNKKMKNTWMIIILIVNRDI